MSPAGPFIRPEPHPLPEPGDNRSDRIPWIGATIVFIGILVVACAPLPGEPGRTGLVTVGLIGMACGAGISLWPFLARPRRHRGGPAGPLRR